MDWVWFLFKFDGRINRAKMWLALLVIICWVIFLSMLILIFTNLLGNPVSYVELGIGDVFWLIDPAVLRAFLAELREGRQASAAHLVLVFLETCGTLLLSWVYVATAIKRLHDRDKSAWWAIPYLVMPSLYGQFSARLPDSHLMLLSAWAAILFAGFVDLYCLKGTRSTNRFGPNPLPKEQGSSSRGTSSGWNQTDAMEFVPHQASPLPGMRVKRGHD
jgi:uncharacterized membrane protein YhaH (DUF805 family)